LSKAIPEDPVGKTKKI